MVEFQGCAATAAAALDDPSLCASPHQTNSKPPVLSSVSQKHISDQGGGEEGGVSVEEEERRGGDFGEGEDRGGGGRGTSTTLDGPVRSGGGGGGAFGPRQALKRSRLVVEDDDQLSIIPPIDFSGANDHTPPLFHHPYHHQQLYQHQHHNPEAVEASSNFSTMHSSDQQLQHHHHQQVSTPGQNGHHSSASAHHVETSHFGGGDAHLMSGVGNNHYHGGGFLYPAQMQGQGVAGFNGLNVADVLAELERERKKNAELQGRLSSLEARLGKGSNDDKNIRSVQNGAKKSKKHRRAEKTTRESESEESRRIVSQADDSSAIKQEEGVVLHVTLPLEDPILTHRNDTGVTWMSREEVTPAELEKLSKDIISERDDSGDSDDDDDDEDEDEDELEEYEDSPRAAKKKKMDEGEQQGWRDIDMGGDGQRGEVLGEVQKLSGASGKRDPLENGIEGVEKKGRRRGGKERRKGKQGEKAFYSKRGFGTELVSFRGPGAMSYKKAPKTAFCPNEVKRIMESGVLALKNAQSHTMRKIIVFASLGIRHGCEDLYELDFSHFSVVQRGEPYKSAKEPGEHVLYDQVGLRTKIFYPNRQNPILCPVRILDEEKSMRPAGPSCPTCLFLCIKYGGRTRNLPQNEYVRQRMGRNKLKSFGPLMCQMALLVHIRTGSFFFKALGITLLFMAGFPDDLVRKETKYRNLDLLQKYYRSDEDAKGEHLFHPYPTFFPPAMMVQPPSAQKGAGAAKGAGKKGPPPLLSKPPLTPAVARYLPPLSTRSPPAMPFPGLPSPFSSPVPAISPGLPTSGTSSGHPSPTGPPPPPPPAPPPPPFGMYTPYPPTQGGFMPMPWAPVHSYPPGPYPPPPFAYQPFSHSPQFLPPYYGPPFRFPPYGQQSSTNEEKKAEEPGDSDSDSDSGSSGAGKTRSEKGNKKEVLRGN